MGGRLLLTPRGRLRPGGTPGCVVRLRGVRISRQEAGLIAALQIDPVFIVDKKKNYRYSDSGFLHHRDLLLEVY